MVYMIVVAMALAGCVRPDNPPRVGRVEYLPTRGRYGYTSGYE